MRKRLKLVLACLLVVAVGVFIYRLVLPEVLPAPAQLVVMSGEVVLGSARTISGEKSEGETISPKESLDVRGIATLELANVAVDIAPGTRLSLDRHHWYPLDGWQIALSLQSGQIRCRVGNLPMALKLATPSGVLLVPDPNSEFVVQANPDGRVQVGALNGGVTVSAGKSVRLGPGEGTIVLPEKAPDTPGRWGRLQIILYTPEQSKITLPVSMTSATSGEKYDFLSEWEYLLPEDKYALKIDLLRPYEAQNLQVVAAESNIWPITLGEVAFALTDASGNPIRNAEITVQADGTSLRTRGDGRQGLLISPGSWNLTTSRPDAPQLTQNVNLNIEPGQRVLVPLRDDLFGGGALRVNLVTADGTPAPGVPIRVFKAGEEDKEPILTFNTGEISLDFAPGKYVLSVMTAPIAARLEVTITGETPILPIDLGYGMLRINYTDRQGRPSNRDVVLGVSSALRDFDVRITEMRNVREALPYVAGIRSGQQVIIPAGVYTILLDDIGDDIFQENVIIRAGQTTTLDLKAP